MALLTAASWRRQALAEKFALDQSGLPCEEQEADAEKCAPTTTQQTATVAQPRRSGDADVDNVRSGVGRRPKKSEEELCKEREVETVEVVLNPGPLDLSLLVHASWGTHIAALCFSVFVVRGLVRMLRG